MAAAAQNQPLPSSQTKQEQTPATLVKQTEPNFGKYLKISDTCILKIDAITAISKYKTWNEWYISLVCGRETHGLVQSDPYFSSLNRLWEHWLENIVK